ncbi:hypothetical protein J8273_8503 [Carpediemonas membranifera]|uniref:Uncharacterized protein n=1 Tax=Carpediemonas membranifera TaxID=201153 RepID=A0A8J6AXQ8_9EUKA|nr:hypothetical protein J8273_8503 [Carpediemonas membranifera]|eukprot:KAG9389824.1 hypothetical protein J8273_8503 [Carpediemonas membranifera]
MRNSVRTGGQGMLGTGQWLLHQLQQEQEELLNQLDEMAEQEEEEELERQYRVLNNVLAKIDEEDERRRQEEAASDEMLRYTHSRFSPVFRTTQHSQARLSPVTKKSSRYQIDTTGTEIAVEHPFSPMQFTEVDELTGPEPGREGVPLFPADDEVEQVVSFDPPPKPTEAPAPEETTVDYDYVMGHLPLVDMLLGTDGEDPDYAVNEQDERQLAGDTGDDFRNALNKFREMAERESLVVVGETAISKVRIHFYTMVFSHVLLALLKDVKTQRRKEMKRLIPAFVERTGAWLAPCTKSFVHNMLAFPHTSIFLKTGFFAELTQTAKTKEKYGIRLRVRLRTLFDSMDSILEAGIPSPILDFFGLFLTNPAVDFNVPHRTFAFERKCLRLQQHGVFQSKATLDAYLRDGIYFSQTDAWALEMNGGDTSDDNKTRMTLATKMRAAVKKRKMEDVMCVVSAVMDRSTHKQGIVHPLLTTFVFVHALGHEALLNRSKDLIISQEAEEAFRQNIAFFASLIIHMAFSALDNPVPTDLPMRDDMASSKTVTRTVAECLSQDDWDACVKRMRGFVVRLHTAVIRHINKE